MAYNMWVLVAIAITGTSTVTSQDLGRYTDMTDCFYARQNVLVELKAYTGVPPINTQYVCVPTDKY